MKKLNCLIIILIIIIIILLIAILLLKNYNQSNDVGFTDTYHPVEEEYFIRGAEELDEETQLAIPENTDLESLEDALYYFVVKNCMQQYLHILNTESSIYYGYDENDNYTSIASESEKKENIYKILSSNYIEKNNINNENLYNYVTTYKENTLFVPLEIKQIDDSEEIKSFIVSGISCNMEDNSLIENIYAIVNIDENNLTFSIEPVHNVNNIDNIKFEKLTGSIELNEKNVYQYQTILDEDISKEYMLTYKRLSIAAPELMYEKFNKEYKEKRFGSLENFKEYVQENKDKIFSTSLTKYLVEEKDGYKQYVLLDKNNNYYIFQETYPMQYTVMLDTYTIDLPEFIEKYNNADKPSKVKMNITRFFEAIKLSDYEYAYEKLDETFKNQYFATLSEFEKYAKENLKYDEKIDYIEFSDSDEIYTYDIELKNGENIKYVTFTVQLLDSTDYKISFDIN